MNDLFVDRLSQRLAGPLPGPMVGSRFAPVGRPSRSADRIPSDARLAAVLVLLYPHRGMLHLPLTVRHDRLPDHPGQVSLPGGAIEQSESSQAAALREFHEELGADGHKIELLGRLSEVYVEVSNFAVQPWIGATADRPLLVPNPAEVQQVLEVPLAELVDPANLGCHQRRHEGEPYTAPHFSCQSHRVWGATCLILGELVTLLDDLGPVAF